jgi:hypothetical protein
MAQFLTATDTVAVIKSPPFPVSAVIRLTDHVIRNAQFFHPNGTELLQLVFMALGEVAGVVGRV